MRNLHKSVCIVLSILAVSFSGMMVEAAEEKVDVLIVTGFDVGSHKWEDSTKLVQAILVKTGRFDVTVSKDKEVFASPTLKDYPVIVLLYGFWNEADPSDKAKAGLIDYAKNGGNVESQGGDVVAGRNVRSSGAMIPSVGTGNRGVVFPTPPF